MSSKRYDFLVKAVVVGDPNVGKTAFTRRAELKTRLPDKHHTATIGVDLTTCIVSVTDPTTALPVGIKFHLWDTAGQEQFASLTRSYYRNVQVAILMYDCSRQETATHLLTRWWSELSTNTDVSNLVVAVVGNKKDLPAAHVQPAILNLLDLISHTSRVQPLHVQISTLKDSDVTPVLGIIGRLCLERDGIRKDTSHVQGFRLAKDPPSKTTSTMGLSCPC